MKHEYDMQVTESLKIAQAVAWLHHPVVFPKQMIMFKMDQNCMWKSSNGVHTKGFLR